MSDNKPSQNSDKNVNFLSGDIESKEKINYFTKIQDRSRLKRLVHKFGAKKLIIISILFVAILAVVIVSVCFIIGNQNTTKSEDIQSQLEQYSEDLSQYIFENNTPEAFDSLESRLVTLINSNEDLSVKTEGIVMLAQLYSANFQYQSAIDVLNDGLETTGLSDQNQFSLLVSLIDIYDAIGADAEQVSAIQLLLQLPEDMTLELTDWPAVRETYQNKLEEIIGENNEDLQ